MQNLDLAANLASFKDFGFDVALEFPFTYERYKPQGEAPDEILYVMWHDPYGILLVFDTHRGREVINGGKFYYNWKPRHEGKNLGVLESGGFVRCQYKSPVWSGHHDCRNGISPIKTLATAGTFVTPWVDQPFLWLVHYGDEHHIQAEYGDDLYAKSDAYKRLTFNRLARLPEAVRTRILAPSALHPSL